MEEENVAVPEPPVKKKRKKRRKWIGQKGGLRPKYKLTEEDVHKIWYLLNHSDYSQTKIAEMFNVGQEAISHINTGSRWNQVTGLPRRDKSSVGLPPSGFISGRPRQTYLDSLKTKALKADFEKLQDGCIQALLGGHKHLLIKFYIQFKFPKDFPVHLFEYKDGRDVVYSVNSKALLTWMNKKGYSPYTVKDILDLKRQMGVLLSLADRQLGVSIVKEELKSS